MVKEFQNTFDFLQPTLLLLLPICYFQARKAKCVLTLKHFRCLEALFANWADHQTF